MIAVMRDGELEAVLAEVSIPGRMAWAVDCIAAWAALAEVDSPLVERSLAHMRRFCGNWALDEWERELMREFPNVEAAIAEETGDAALATAIDVAFNEIGRGNLYAAVRGRSELTLRGALKIAALAAEAGIPVLDGRDYLADPFTAGGGWGNDWRPESWSPR